MTRETRASSRAQNVQSLDVFSSRDIDSSRWPFRLVSHLRTGSSPRLTSASARDGRLEGLHHGLLVVALVGAIDAEIGAGASLGLLRRLGNRVRKRDELLDDLKNGREDGLFL